MRAALIFAALALAGCPAATGTLGGYCFGDGTCSAPALSCQASGDGMRCWPKPEARTCNGDADCFCEACLKRCGDAGVKRCEFSDVSVWGSKPTVCECRS